MAAASLASASTNDIPGLSETDLKMKANLIIDIQMDMHCRWNIECCCIYKVPHYLRKGNPEAYSPQLISIGHIYYRQKSLMLMEKHVFYLGSSQLVSSKQQWEVGCAETLLHSNNLQTLPEICCGDITTETLVTTCHAVSQQELGSLVIASFGTKGNIKLLHDFD
ncbi:hypothetical protein L6164_002605 [Bauhinia variegata]|uniref:Uncharacterized protein n=1 Tax=Bauhinia variegata TaxID=167791 RepID=A0ACB9Q0K4_BAUVA|nr:hypothetical protein L6164_002605 [Bauhinia variegata]